MTTAALFPRSFRSLRSDLISWRILRLVVAGLLIAGWTSWFCLAEVPLYELSSSARVAVLESVYPIQVLATGRVSALLVTPGQKVAAGEPVAELDGEAQRLLLAEEQARLEAVSAQLPTLNQELESEEAAARELQHAAAAAEDEAQARLREARTAARLAEEEVERRRPLYQCGKLRQLDWNRTETRWRQLRAEADAARLALARHQAEWQARRLRQAAILAELAREASALEGQAAAGTETVKRLRHQLELRLVRAPVAGTVAEVASIPIKAMVSPGDTLATLVPSGRLQVVAQLYPTTALGRIHRGQPAQVRLLGFPWVEYGALKATVSTVAGEVRNGRLRVDLELDPQQECSVTLQHGMPGLVQIEVERVTPATLVLRVAGKVTGKGVNQEQQR